MRSPAWDPMGGEGRGSGPDLESKISAHFNIVEVQMVWNNVFPLLFDPKNKKCTFRLRIYMCVLIF